MTGQDRRALLLGAAVVAIAALAFRGLPWGAHRFLELRGTALERQATLARTRSVLAGRLAVRDSFERVVSGIMGLAPHILDGRTAADAQASLSGLVSLAAGRHAVRVLRVDPVPPSDTASTAFRRISIHAEFEGDIGGILRLVRALETSDPVLTITALDIVSPNPTADQRQPEALRSEMTVAGYYLPRNGP